MNNIPKDKIIKVIEIFFPDAKIYLFGSRAKNNYQENSDVDIAIDAGKPITMTEKGQINSMLDALNIPQKIGVVDFNRAPQPLKENIIREGIVWKQKKHIGSSFEDFLEEEGIKEEVNVAAVKAVIARNLKEQWLFDPKSKALVDELKETLKQKANRSIDLSSFEEE